MNGLIKNNIYTQNAFMRVTDMGRAVEWYSKILHLPMNPTSRVRTSEFLTLPVGDVFARNDNSPSKRTFQHPICAFETPDIQAAHQFLKQNHVDMMENIQDNNSIRFFTFKDLDGNMLLVYQIIQTRQSA
jgi:hypothetical protein